MAVTQKEIAEKLGLSRQLVNFALNGVGSVSEQTRREILQTASEMGYRTNELARAVATGRSRLIGLVAIQNGGDNMFRNLSGALQTAAAHGYSTKVLLLPWDGRPEELKAIMRRCSEWRLDGILAINLREHMFDYVHQEMKGEEIPLVYLEEKPKTPEPCITVGTDERAGIRLGLQHLVELGHQRITFVSGAPDGSMSSRRTEMFLDAMKEQGLPLNDNSTCMCAWERPDLIIPAVEGLFKTPQPPTALMCAGDSIAMIAIHAISELGLKVPTDVSVMGFGDFQMARFGNPPLTTLAQSFHEMGSLGIEKLLSQITGTTPPPQANIDEKLQPSLIVRKSTAPPPTKL